MSRSKGGAKEPPALFLELVRFSEFRFGRKDLKHLMGFDTKAASLEFRQIKKFYLINEWKNTNLMELVYCIKGNVCVC